LVTVFDFAVRSDRDEIRRAIQNGGDDVGRLFRLGVELSHPQTLQLARQIKESVDRRRLSQTEAPDTDAPVDYVMPALKALPRASGSTVEESKPSGGDRLAAVVAFLREALAQGPPDVKIIERRAVEAGLLEENTPISKSKVFRSARALLGVKSHQKPGRRAGGWIWSLPDQVAAGSGDL